MDELGRKSVEDFKMANKKPIVVVMDNIRSMHNVGSVFRTSDGFLIDGICLCGFTPQPPHRDIHKTALGSTETVDWVYYENAVNAVHDLKAKGFKVFAIEQTQGSISLEKFKQRNRTLDRAHAARTRTQLHRGTHQARSHGLPCQIFVCKEVLPRPPQSRVAVLLYRPK